MTSPTAKVTNSLYQLRGDLYCSWWRSRTRERTNDGDREDVKADRDRRAERLLLHWWAASVRAEEQVAVVAQIVAWLRKCSDASCLDHSRADEIERRWGSK